MSEQNGQHGQHEQEHHIVSPRIYLVIFFGLLVATALTCGVSYLDMGEWHVAPGVTIFWNPVVALAIACSKAMLVVLFFMHIKYSTKLTKLTVFSGLFTFMALIGMTMCDYMSRAWGRW